MTKKQVLDRLKNCGLSCCISFTLVNLILSVLHLDAELMQGNFWRYNLEIFVVCFVIALLMFIVSLFSQEDNPLRMTPGAVVIDLLCVAAPVLGLGGFVFRWFNPFSVYVLYPIVILLVVYALTAAAIYWNARRTEKEINQAITDRNKQRNREKENDNG